jgi:hypothetical protein
MSGRGAACRAQVARDGVGQGVPDPQADPGGAAIAAATPGRTSIGPHEAAFPHSAVMNACRRVPDPAATRREDLLELVDDQHQPRVAAAVRLPAVHCARQQARAAALPPARAVQ